ncbi:unnamed protein product [Adineta steineri]|uniref:F-box domain-containing protein n=1 Tax=Adineta steineri TaxID=433720 RepID=A0A818N6S2_9BILA|nr:unnamed protein product [Adineta steineri]CAF3600135.1 unnamed protein product [Adineta steineri]
MSDYDIQHRSSLEIFPDELFFELFEYIPIYDLYRTFFGLNQRINCILENLSNLFAEWTTNSDDEIIDKFSSCISRLIVWRGGYLNLKRFHKVRSLKLCLPTIEQCNEIQPSLTLEHLHIESSGNKNTITDQLSLLLLTNAFPRLRICRIDEIKFDKENCQQIPTLHTLITRTQSPEKLFSLCPMLTYLRLNLKENVTESLEFESHLNLRHLELGIYSTEITLSTIVTILSLLPNLTRFTLDGPCNPPPQNKIDICSLAPLLTRYLTNLRIIHISLPLNDNHLDPKEFENEKELLKKLHPLFNQIIFRSRSYYAPGRLLISSITDNHKSTRM